MLLLLINLLYSGYQLSLPVLFFKIWLHRCEYWYIGLCLFTGQLLAHLSTKCSVSYCDHLPSVGFRLSVHIFLVYILASTNINLSTPNLVTMYTTIQSRMSLIMNLLRPELYELYALEFAIFDSVNTLATANKDQSAPNLVKIYMTIRC